MKKQTLILFSLAFLMLAAFRIDNRARFEGGKFGDSFTQLNFKSDRTFSYTDHFNPQKQVNVSGNWEQEGNVLILRDFSSPFKIHDRWKITSDGKALISRRGLEWIRICRL
jgi:hypothetical protein